MRRIQSSPKIPCEKQSFPGLNKTPKCFLITFLATQAHIYFLQKKLQLELTTTTKQTNRKKKTTQKTINKHSIEEGSEVASM